MYDQAVIKQAFMGLVGLRQNDNPNFSPIADYLTYTGQNVLLYHSLLNIENIDMCARNYDKYNYPAWLIGTTYNTGDKVKVSSVVYRSKGDGNIGHAVTDLTYWDVVDLLSAFLDDIFTTSIEDVLNQVYLRKKLASQTKTLIKNIRLYNDPGSITDLTISEGALVGVEIKLKYSENLVAIVNRIGLQLSQPQTGSDKLRMYLFHSSVLEPIATQDISHTKAVSFQWHDSALQMHYMNPDYEAGGVFYLMYDQNDLIGQAVKKKHNFGLSPAFCGHCSPTNIVNWNLYNKFISIRSVMVKAENRNVDDPLLLWDISKNTYVFDNNFGINLEVTVRCDLTQFLIQQKDVFSYAVRDMTVVKLLEMLANSTRQSGVQEKTATMARAELTAPIAGGMGIKKKLEDQLDGVDFEISELDNVCIPCNKRSGLSYGTIY